MNKLLLLVVVFLSTCFTNASKPRIWTRIPPFFVRERVNYFLDSNQITNCFEFRESPTNLLLKCWRNNKLVDINIDISETYKKQQLYVTSISI